MIEPSKIQTKGASELKALVGEYEFFVQKAGFKITVKVWKTDRAYGTSWYTYTTSHAIHTPVQATPYHPSGPFADSEEGALRKAIMDIMGFFSGAVSKGHEPSDEWFVPNSSY